MGDEPLDDEARRELLRRIRRQSAAVGAQVPETVTVDGTEIALREFVVETREQSALSASERDRVRAVRDALGAERERRRKRLERDDLTVEEATALADSIVGLDRAMAALADLRSRSLEADKREQVVESHRSWVSFLDRIQQ